MNRMKILKNPEMPLSFAPIEKGPTENLPPINYLLPFKSFESLRDGGLSWEQFLLLFDIRYRKKTAYRRLGINQLSNLFGDVETAEDDRRVHFVFMNPFHFPEIRTWGPEIADSNNDASLIQQGQMGYVWGSMVLAHRQIPCNLILVSSEDCIGGILELGEKTFEEAQELVQLEDTIRELSANLNSKYRRMIEIIHNTVEKIENKDQH